MVSFSSFAKSAAVLSTVFFLSACSSDLDTDISSIFSPKTPLPCPRVSVLPNADSVTIFRDGPGRDLVDVLYEGVIAPVSGECFYEDDDSKLVVELILRIGAIKGPAAISQSQNFPFFVAIARNDKRIIAKKVLNSPVEVQEGRRRGAVQEEIVHHIPLPSGLDGRHYTIVLGFQLTKEQLEHNRKAAN